MAIYLQDTVGGKGVGVYESSIEIGGVLMLLAPNHRIRRLVVAIDRRKESRIHRDQVRELAARIWGFNAAEELARIEAAKVAAKVKQLKDWGW